jgi:excisionase family DNA binding protein
LRVLAILSVVLLMHFPSRESDSAPPVLTPAQAARELGVSESTVRRWLAEGRLNGFRIGGRLRLERHALERVVRPADEGRA